MLPIIIAVFFLMLAVGVFVVFMGRTRGDGSSGGKKHSKNREAQLRDANKRLSQNPLDPHALHTVGEIQLEEGSYDKAIKSYETLLDLASRGHAQGIDPFEIYLHYAECALKLNMTEQAYKGFTMARSIKQNNFEVNYNLGVLEFERKNYEKAIQLFQQARTMDPENPATLRYMGHAFFRLKKPKEAMNFIRKAIDLAPDDKESLYTLAECYYEASQTEQAMRIFSHLRPDPLMGPSACLFTGMIHVDSRKNDLAIQDFEMGLKHQNIKPEILADLRYYLATTYIKQSEINKAIPILKLIQANNPGYKDVSMLISKYQELNANRNLQTFLISSSADFVALCRKVVMSYFAKAKVKVINIAVNKNEWADILAEVSTPKWADLIMFRFIRTQGIVGELVVRDFHSHLKEVKAGKGICITVGSFNEEAKRYTEARLIDLIEKERLISILNTVDARTAVIGGKR
ncbi:MAG: tetratricopeptide repeat protein [Treponema sp.]|jgi:tetratricopeptide (TPR) repeat protein|nr:tetratricopeptide repeat protein [Treponema sp.]